MELIPALICENRDGGINHVDIGMCKKRYFFSSYVPIYEKCSDKFNRHYCKLLTKEEITELQKKSLY